MKKTVIAMIALFGLGLGTASASLLPPPQMVYWAATHTAAVYASHNGEFTRACETEDNVLATRHGGYNFEVTACDFKANADHLTLVK